MERQLNENLDGINNFADIIVSNDNSEISNEDNLELTYRNIMLNEYSSSDEDSFNTEDNFISKIYENFDVLNLMISDEYEEIDKQNNKIKKARDKVSKEAYKKSSVYTSEIKKCKVNDSFIKQSILFKSKSIVEFNFLNNKVSNKDKELLDKRICVSMKLLSQYPNSKLYKLTSRLFELEKLSKCSNYGVFNNPPNNFSVISNNKLLDSIDKENNDNKHQENIKDKTDNKNNGVISNKQDNEKKISLLELEKREQENKEINSNKVIYNISKNNNHNTNPETGNKAIIKYNNNKIDFIHQKKNHTKDQPNNYPNTFINKSTYNIDSFLSNPKIIRLGQLVILDGKIIVIDRDYKNFANMISFMRTEVFYFDDKIEENNFIEEMMFWEIVMDKDSKLIINYYNTLFYSSIRI